jgi:hypothetical protein
VRRGKLRGVRVQMSNGEVRWLVAEEELASIETVPADTEGYLTPSEFGAVQG